MAFGEFIASGDVFPEGTFPFPRATIDFFNNEPALMFQTQEDNGEKTLVFREKGQKPVVFEGTREELESMLEKYLSDVTITDPTPTSGGPYSDFPHRKTLIDKLMAIIFDEKDQLPSQTEQTSAAAAAADLPAQAGTPSAAAADLSAQAGASSAADLPAQTGQQQQQQQQQTFPPSQERPQQQTFPRRQGRPQQQTFRRKQSKIQ